MFWQVSLLYLGISGRMKCFFLTPKYSLKTLLCANPIWVLVLVNFYDCEHFLILLPYAEAEDVRWSVNVIKMKIVYIFPSARTNKTTVDASTSMCIILASWLSTKSVSAQRGLMSGRLPAWVQYSGHACHVLCGMWCCPCSDDAVSAQARLVKWRLRIGTGVWVRRPAAGCNRVFPK